MKILLLLLSLPLFAALDNSFTVTNWNGTGSGATRGSASTLQTARPITLHRVFAQGEIAAFPQPRVGGAAATTWQADVHSRYRDASVARSCSAVGQNAAGAIQVTCNGHAFQNLETVVIAGIPGLNGAKTVYEPTTNTFLIRGTYAGPYTLTSATATGPTYGSVKAAHVSLKSNIAANGSIVVDFVNNANPCSSGNRAACDSASLNQAGMLAFSSWNFKIDATAASVTKSGDARTMLTAGSFSYWLRGPVVTSVMVEDMTSADPYSFGWHNNAGTMTVDAGAQYKSLLPRFVLTFYPGWSGVKGECILENSWINRIQDQVYSLSIKTGATPSEVYSKATFNHFSRTRWHKIFWDGTAPGDVWTDYNLKYLVYSKATMPYNTEFAANPAGQGWYDLYLTGDKGEIMGKSYVTQNMGEGEEEAGVLQGADANYLATGGPKLHDTLFGTKLNDSAGSYVVGGGGTSAVPSHVPLLLRADESSLNYCVSSCPEGAAVQTYGRMYSIEANSNGRNYNNWNIGTAVGQGLDAGWGFSTTHMWNNSYAPWLVTGDPYYAEDLLTWANYLSLNPNQDVGDYMRHYQWGYHNEIGFELRGSAWGISMLASAAFAQPDGTPEKALMTRLVETQFAVPEGQLGITDGLFGPGYPCTSAGYAPTFNATNWTMAGYADGNGDYCNRWFWGLSRVYSRIGESGGWDAPTTLLRNPLRIMERGGNYLAQVGERMNGTFAWSNGAMYMFHYKWAAMARAKLFGFVAADSVLRETAKFFVNVSRHPNGNPFLLTEYRIPLRKRAAAPVPVTTVTFGDSWVITAAGHGLSAGDRFALCCTDFMNQPGNWNPDNANSWGSVVTTAPDANTFTLKLSFLLSASMDATQNVMGWKANPGSSGAEGNVWTYYQVGSEKLLCPGYDWNSHYFTSCTRGALGTTAASHAADAVVFPVGTFTPGNAWVNGSLFGGPFQTLANWKQGFAYPTLNALYGASSDIQDGYSQYALGVSALLAGYSDASTLEGYSRPRTGNATTDWFRGNVNYQDMLPDNIKWAFKQNQIRNVLVTPGTTSVVLRWDDVDGGGSTVAVSATPFASSSDAGDTAVAGGKRRKTATITGLTGATTYYYRITHGADRALGTFVTN